MPSIIKPNMGKALFFVAGVFLGPKLLSKLR